MCARPEATTGWHMRMFQESPQLGNRAVSCASEHSIPSTMQLKHDDTCSANGAHLTDTVPVAASIRRGLANGAPPETDSNNHNDRNARCGEVQQLGQTTSTPRQVCAKPSYKRQIAAVHTEHPIPPHPAIAQAATATTQPQRGRTPAATAHSRTPVLARPVEPAPLAELCSQVAHLEHAREQGLRRGGACGALEPRDGVAAAHPHAHRLAEPVPAAASTESREVET